MSANGALQFHSHEFHVRATLGSRSSDHQAQVGTWHDLCMTWNVHHGFHLSTLHFIGIIPWQGQCHFHVTDFFSSQPIVALLPNGRFFLSRSFSSSDWDRLHAVSLERPPLADQRDDRSARPASSRRNETGVTASICCNLPLRDFAMAPPTSSQSQSPGFLETIRQIAEHRCVRPSWRLKGWSEENGNKSFPENEHWQVLGAIAWGCEWGIRSIHDPILHPHVEKEWVRISFELGTDVQIISSHDVEFILQLILPKLECMKVQNK